MAEETDRERLIYQAASLIEQLGPQGARHQASQIGLLLDSAGWAAADQLAACPIHLKREDGGDE